MQHTEQLGSVQNKSNHQHFNLIEYRLNKGVTNQPWKFCALFPRAWANCKLKLMYYINTFRLHWSLNSLLNVWYPLPEHDSCLPWAVFVSDSHYSSRGHERIRLETSPCASSPDEQVHKRGAASWEFSKISIHLSQIQFIFVHTLTLAWDTYGVFHWYCNFASLTVWAWAWSSVTFAQCLRR